MADVVYLQMGRWRVTLVTRVSTRSRRQQRRKFWSSMNFCLPRHRLRCTGHIADCSSPKQSSVSAALRHVGLQFSRPGLQLSESQSNTCSATWSRTTLHTNDMSKTAVSTSRLLAGISRVTPSATRPLVSQPWTVRSFSQTPLRRADDSGMPNPPGMDHALSAMEQLQQSTSKLAIDAVARARNVSPTSDSLMERVGLDAASEGEQQPYHFHVYAHRHNCHITVTKPNRDAIISVSCGNLGFKKSQRKHYDSAYQLGAYVIDKLHQGGWHKKIKQMEVVLRGFGQGREAVTKVLLGTQGKMLRNSIVRVADATRLKFGGTRSPKPRRLG